MGVSFSGKGNFDKTVDFMHRMKDAKYLSRLDKYGKIGVSELEKATPRRTGLTAASWNYEITKDHNGYNIYWTNSNLAEEGMPVVLLLQYGHGTANGGYVQGIDFINPALKPVFEAIADQAWKEMTK